MTFRVLWLHIYVNFPIKKLS